MTGQAHHGLLQAARQCCTLALTNLQRKLISREEVSSPTLIFVQAWQRRQRGFWYGRQKWENEKENKRPNPTNTIITWLFSINSELFKQTYIYLLCSQDEEFRFLNWNSVREWVHIFLTIFRTIKIICLHSPNHCQENYKSNLKMFSFSKLLYCLATNYYLSLFFTCLMPGDVALYFWVCSLFEAAWTSRCLSPTASPLRKKKMCTTFQLRQSMINVFTRTLQKLKKKFSWIQVVHETNSV